MRLLMAPSGVTQLEARPMTALVGASSLDVDLEREHELRDLREVRRTPLDLLLGAVSDSPTRALEVAVWGAGIDWADRAAGRRRLRAPGTRLTGRDVVVVVRDALARRRRDLAGLAQSAALLTGEAAGTTLDDAQGALKVLSRLVAPVRLVAEYDLEADAVFDAHTAEDLFALAAVELLVRGRHGAVVERCAHCGCLFVVRHRSDELYCRRAAPGEAVGGRGCHQVGPQARYRDRLGDLAAVYRRRYKRLDQRARRGRFSRRELDQWRARAHVLVEQARQHKWDSATLDAALAHVEPTEG